MNGKLFIWISLSGASVFGLSCSQSPPTSSATEGHMPPEFTAREWQELTNNPAIQKWLTLPTSQKFVSDFAKKAKKTLDLEWARSWANGLIQSQPEVKNLTQVDIPEALQKLEPDATPFGSIHRDEADGTGVVYVEWGGGWQHWGLAFTERRSLLDRRRIQVERVTNGIYAFVTVDAVNPNP